MVDWFVGCLLVWLFVWFFSCYVLLVVWLFICSVVCLFGCLIVRLFSSFVVWLFRFWLFRRRCFHADREDHGTLAVQKGHRDQGILAVPMDH